jgi:hypothetical protein
MPDVANKCAGFYPCHLLKTPATAGLSAYVNTLLDSRMTNPIATSLEVLRISPFLEASIS